MLITNVYSLVSAPISSANTPRQSPFCGKTKGGGLEPAEPYASYAPDWYRLLQLSLWIVSLTLTLDHLLLHNYVQLAFVSSALIWSFALTRMIITVEETVRHKINRIASTLVEMTVPKQSYGNNKTRIECYHFIGS